MDRQADHDEIDIFRGLRYRRGLHEKHLQIIETDAPVTCIVAGRRFGKTYAASVLFCRKLLEELERRADEIDRGEAPAWEGAGQPRSVAKRCLDGVVIGVIAAPSRKQLGECRSYLEQRFRRSGADRLFHPDPLMSHAQKPDESWLLLGGAAAVVKYIIAGRASSVVGGKASLLWVSEAGFVDDESWLHLSPIRLDDDANLIAEGVPSLGTSSWFVQLAISGLVDGDPRVDRSVAARDENVVTIIGSSREAYSLTARAAVAREIERAGENSLIVSWQFEGDWRQTDRLIFSEWDATVHVVRAEERFGVWTITTSDGKVRTTRTKPTVMGSIDWFRGYHPGGGIVVWVWRVNPFDQSETRPLVCVVDEFEATRHDSVISDDAFIGRLLDLQRRWGVETWANDPTSPQISQLARRKGLRLRATPNAEKVGRVALLARLLHHAKGIAPCLFVSDSCPIVARQFGNYRWATDRQGRPKGTAVQFDDFAIDAAAYLTPMIGLGRGSGGRLNVPAFLQAV